MTRIQRNSKKQIQNFKSDSAVMQCGAIGKKLDGGIL
jgi:hypothetical protein